MVAELEDDIRLSAMSKESEAEGYEVCDHITLENAEVDNKSSHEYKKNLDISCRECLLTYRLGLKIN